MSTGILVYLKVIKESLSEFHTRLEEDPDLFINISSELLSKINFPETIYVLVLSLQFRRQAASVAEGLVLEWKDLKKELLLRFESEGIKVLLGADASKYHHLRATLFHLRLSKQAIKRPVFAKRVEDLRNLGRWLL